MSKIKNTSPDGTPATRREPVVVHNSDQKQDPIDKSSGTAPKQTPAQVRRSKDPATIAAELAALNKLPLVKWSIMENGVLKVQLARSDPKLGNLFLYEPLAPPKDPLDPSD